MALEKIALEDTAGKTLEVAIVTLKHTSEPKRGEPLFNQMKREKAIPATMEAMALDQAPDGAKTYALGPIGYEEGKATPADPTSDGLRSMPTPSNTTATCLAFYFTD